jgi:glycosyltransferase involved in cell wall biosynthesis
MLNLFYEEPDPDRWLPYDRYPRRAIRRLLRGKSRISGQARVFVNLCAGLERLAVPYRVNDYAHVRHNPEELACIIGKPFLLDRFKWRNPILLGAAIYSHPSDDPHLLERLPVRKILVPGPWIKTMFEAYWNGVVKAWPVGIDTDCWMPSTPADKVADVLLYDKVRWDHDRYEVTLIAPIREFLSAQGHTFQEIRYGHYREEEFQRALSDCQTMIFLCEHETQGIAYQQALSCGVPIFAWDRGGAWRDPAYYPHKADFGPVSSVPYWDERCGMKFRDCEDFLTNWRAFWDQVQEERFQPRDYVLENLTLEKCASEYVRIARNVIDQASAHCQHRDVGLQSRSDSPQSASS